MSLALLTVRETAEHMHAGQGLVAFARGVHDQLDYAIKLFLSQSSFEAERSLYETKALGALLPQVLALLHLVHNASLTTE